MTIPTMTIGIGYMKNQNRLPTLSDNKECPSAQKVMKMYGGAQRSNETVLEYPSSEVRVGKKF